MPKFALALLLACLLLPTAAFADKLTPQKAADIKKLFVISKMDALAADIIDLQISQGTAMAESEGITTTPELKRLVETELRALFKEKIVGPGGAFDQLVPIYAEMFTHKEIKQYIAFYNTPLGRKIAATEAKASTRVSLVFLGALSKAGEEIPERLKALMQREGLQQKMEQKAPAQI
ncbi:DUF2059 domain-containing protein [Humidesulfovibrio idahonensis]